MKKRIFFVILGFILVALTSCINISNDTALVTYDLGNGVVETRVLKIGDEMSYPELPNIDNYAHIGWFYDKEGKMPVGDGVKVYSDTTVYSLWMYDYAGVTNQIFADQIKINVTVMATSYNMRFGFVNGEVTSTGSGVIFDEDASYYYCLTNHHVAEKKDGYDNLTIKIEDCYGVEHEAMLKYSNSSYDLAVVRFKKGDTELRVAELALTPADIGDIVINLGQPEGLKNAVTYGHVVAYNQLGDSLDGNEESDVEFEVMWQNAPINHGSSGGAVLNDELKLVGINFAAGEDASQEMLYAFSIPVDRVREFIAEYKS